MRILNTGNMFLLRRRVMFALLERNIFLGLDLMDDDEDSAYFNI